MSRSRFIEALRAAEERGMVASPLTGGWMALRCGECGFELRDVWIDGYVAGPYGCIRCEAVRITGEPQDDRWPEQPPMPRDVLQRLVNEAQPRARAG